MCEKFEINSLTGVFQFKPAIGAGAKMKKTLNTDHGSFMMQEMKQILVADRIGSRFCIVL